MSQIAVKGSTTSHGGIIITGDPNVLVNGKQVARQWDLHACPVPGHGTNQIISNCIQSFIIDGKPLAVVTSVCSCGAVITTGEDLDVR